MRKGKSPTPAVSTTPTPSHAGDGAGTAEPPVLAPPTRRRPSSRRHDEFSTPDTAARGLRREVHDWLSTGHTIAPHDAGDGRLIVFNCNGVKRRTIPAAEASAVREAEAEYHRRRAEAKDPAAIPVENGGDGKRVDPLALCLETGLPMQLAETKTFVVQITPDIAQALFDRNKRNRPFSKSTGERYAKIIEEGRWVLSSDAIALDWNGNLINGQHRLWAVMDTCVPSWFHINIDLDPAAFAVLDNGKMRNAGDVLSIDGYSHARLRAAVIRLLLAAKAGRLWTNERRAENDEVAVAALGYDERMEACIRAAKQARKKSDGLLAESSIVFVLYVYGRDHAEAIQDYVNRMASQLGFTGEDDPAYVVLRTLQRDRANQTRMRFTEYLALVVKGAEKHIHGEPLRYARGSRVTAWPTISVAESFGWPAQAAPVKRKSTVTAEEPIADMGAGV